MQRKVCIVTGTRAEWGLLSSIAQKLDRREDTELQIIATNMHLSPLYGHTIDEIISEGFKVNACVPMQIAGNSATDTVKSMAMCLDGMASALERLNPDIIVILGDRYEMLAVASAAFLMRIPIVHLHGGEVSEGALDDNIRHSITKLSALHLTSTEQYRQRVIQLGESPERVINTGAIGVYNVVTTPVMSQKELEQSIGTTIDRNTILATLHPATLDAISVDIRCQAFLDALDHFPQSNVIITYPNNDTDGRIIISMIEEYAKRHTDRVTLIPSLGKLRYLSALHYIGVVVGNSSSGIIEVPSMGIPTVDIGCRQSGRIASQSVIHCEADTASIAKAISYALSESGRQRAQTATNPYYRYDTLELIVDAIATTPLETLRVKNFYDINTNDKR